MNIKKELIEYTSQRNQSNPELYADELLTLRYRLNDLQANYDWLEAECEMHRDSYEGMDASHRAELRDKHHRARREYYDNLKEIKAKYLES